MPNFAKPKLTLTGSVIRVAVFLGMAFAMTELTGVVMLVLGVTPPSLPTLCAIGLVTTIAMKLTRVILLRRG
jgi:hypothetical protein